MEGSTGRDEDAGREYNAETSRELLAVAGGDDARFGGIFLKFAPRLKTYLLRLGVTPAVAEEMAQETLLRVWRHAGGFDPKSGDGAGWIFRIARNLRIDAARRERHPDATYSWQTESPPEPTPEETCLAAERARRLEGAIARLPPMQAEMLRRALLRQGTLLQIADDLELPLSTAKSHLRRAIDHVRKHLDEDL